MINIENLYNKKFVSLAYHLFTSSDPLVSLCCELDHELPKLCFVVARAKDYCASIVTRSAKTVLNSTFSISRNTALKYCNNCVSPVLHYSCARLAV